MKLELNVNELNVVLKGLDRYIEDCLESASNADVLKQNILNSFGPVDVDNVDNKEQSIIMHREQCRRWCDQQKKEDKYYNIGERRKWEAEDELYLMSHYGKDSTEDIATHLERSRIAIRTKAHMMGISKKRS